MAQKNDDWLGPIALALGAVVAGALAMFSGNQTKTYSSTPPPPAPKKSGCGCGK